MKNYQTDVAVIGAGLAGIVTALELLDCGYTVALLDGSPDGALGGQANDAFGGMLLTGTAEQARNRIKDSPELLLADWLRAGEFQADDHIAWGCGRGIANTVVCSGGINGNLEKVRQNWDTCYGPPPFVNAWSAAKALAASPSVFSKKWRQNKIRKVLVGTASQNCAEPWMAEPKPHRDVLRRVLGVSPPSGLPPWLRCDQCSIEP
ncbi:MULTISPECIES: FAD-dependent oxidoreductase [unclassified Marinobacter]|uniref:FAD-dependent oxidoreductase n=1 Tax=unclassified Marinobacter TaxID=83889 RepID=UPI000BF3991A|nr:MULTISPECIES: FAD-dependent oxidoreductase [unclassified Marinobacter]PFG11366.1 FAD binding domain-containing protein [Marinobacter sp. LV10MA510-1]PFG53204.1 FAD binding domain-containing protein [Marinobacter sp. LV10R520-4]